jgi:peptide/nickel transport system permease protein
MAITPTVQAGEPLRDSGDRRRLLSRIGFVVATPYRQSAGIARGMLVAGTLVTGLMVVLAVFAPLIAPFRFDQVAGAGGERFPKQEAPSGNHWFGTSVQTFDVFSRVVWGARTELKVVVLSLVLTIAIGVVLGIVSGFVGGWLDRVLVLVMDALFCFPYLLLAIVVAFLLADKLGGGVTTAAAAITAVYIPQYFRVVRNSTVSAKQATYVEAARALGAPAHVIMARYLFTNVVQSVPVIATLNAADAVGTLAALGFLGYGIQPTEAAEWGYDLNRAIDDATSGIWWTAVFPGMAIVLLVMALTLVGEGLNETLNPTLRVRRLLPVVLPPRRGDEGTEPTRGEAREGGTP